MTLDEILPPPFPGFADEGLDLLAALRDHNERDWFKARKATYDDHLKAPLDLLVTDVARAMAAEGLGFTAGRAFRIYRDTRFSKSKAPYKTNVSATFSRPDRDDDPVFVYVHVEPGASFAAAGVYKPPVKWLRPVRRLMARRPGWFDAVRAEVEGAGLEVTPAGHTLAGMPRGFAAHRDEPVAEVLRWETIIARRALSRADVQSTGLADRVVEVARAARPLVRFFDDAHAA